MIPAGRVALQREDSGTGRARSMSAAARKSSSTVLGRFRASLKELFETLIADRMRELKSRIKTESAMTQTAWHRDPDEGFAKTTESLKLQKEQTAKKFGREIPAWLARGPARPAPSFDQPWST